MTRGYISIFAFLLLLGVASSTGCSFSRLANYAVQNIGGISLSAVIMLALMLAIILYLVGTLIKNPRLLFVSKDELTQLILSVVLSVTIIGLLIGACQFNSHIMEFAGNTLSLGITSTADPASDAISVLKVYLRDLSYSITSYIDEGIRMKIDSAVMYMAYNPTDGGEIVPEGAHKAAYSAAYDLLVYTFALPAMVSIKVQSLVLMFIRDMGPYLIGIGILFRLVRPIRKIGNVFLASAVVLLVIYPVIYLFMISYAKSQMGDPPSISGSQNVDIISGKVLWNLAILMAMGYMIPTFVLSISVSFINSLSRGLSIIGT